MSNSLESAMKRTAAHSSPNRQRTFRRDSMFLGGRFDPMVSRELGIIAAEEQTSKQKLLEEAIDLLLVKRKRPSIAELEAR